MKKTSTIISAALLSCAALITTSCDKAKEGAEKAKEVGKEAADKGKEAVDKGMDAAKGAMDALKGQMGGLGDLAKGFNGATTLSALKEKAGGITALLGGLTMPNMPEPVTKAIEAVKAALAKLTGAAEKIPAAAGDDIAALKGSTDEAVKAAATEMESAQTESKGALDGLMKAMGMGE